MKITSIDTFILRTPPRAHQAFSSQMGFRDRNSLLVRVRTDDGLTGWGEGGQWGPAEPVAAAVNYVLAPRLHGRDVEGPVQIWEELYAQTRDFGQKGAYVEAISALDIALWDLCGQRADLPIHALLGGAFRSSAPAYASGGQYDEQYQNQQAAEDLVRDQVTGFVTAGYTTVKIKVGLLSIRDDLARVAAARDAIGDHVGLLVDANHAYTAAAAIKLGRGLEDLGVGWFEEPVVPEDRAGYRRVRAALDIPIAGGEAEFTRYGFRDLLTDECVDIAQPDLCASGGFSEFVKIHALASAHGVQVTPHIWGSAIAQAAAAHALAVLPPTPYTHNPQPALQTPIAEIDCNPNPLRDRLLRTPLQIRDGMLLVPDAPGLGITVDEDAVATYSASRP